MDSSMSGFFHCRRARSVFIAVALFLLVMIGPGRVHGSSGRDPSFTPPRSPLKALFMDPGFDPEGFTTLWPANMSRAGGAVCSGPSEGMQGGVVRDQTGPAPGSGEGKGFLLLASYTENDTARMAVERQIQLFTTVKRDNFAKWLERSGRYLDTIKTILIENGLPEDLVYLPLIESGYSTSARSRAHAVGPWQFIRSTARRYGLKMDYWRDERRDPVKSTRAAARHLKDLYEKFGSWTLALAAYNAGEGKIKRALRRSRSDNYWRIIRTRHLKRETKNYVAKFIAAGIIASDPEKYGFTDIEYHPPMRFEEVEITAPASLSFVARCSNTTEEVIRELNPELRRWCTPPGLESYRIRVPEGTAEGFLKCFNSASAEQRMPKVPYIIRKGDTLYEIAKRFRVSTRELYTLNRGIRPRRLRPGMMIYLPPSRSSRGGDKAGTATYIVKKGDTLYDIATKFSIPRQRLYALNRDLDPRRLRPGDVIYLPLKR